jgi:hypothetical protein
VSNGGERLRDRTQGMKVFSLFSSHIVIFPMVESKNTLKEKYKFNRFNATYYKKPVHYIETEESDNIYVVSKRVPAYLRLVPPPATSLKSMSANPPGSTAGSRWPPIT